MTNRRKRARKSIANRKPVATKVSPLRTARGGPATRGGPSRAGTGPATRLRASSPGDLLDLIPYLLGFHPVESLVVLVVRDGVVQLTARCDLTDGPDRLCRLAKAISAQYRADAVFLACYTATEHSAVEVLDRLLDDPELPPLIDAVRTDGERWWSRACPEDTVDGCRMRTGAMAAEAVFAGLSVAGTRDQAVEAARPPAPDRVAALTEEASRQDQLLQGLPVGERVEEAVLTVSDRALRDDAWPTAERVRLAVLVHDITVRDAVWLLLTRENADAMMSVWSGVVACAAPPHELAPLCLLGLAAWAAGRGALLVACVERASSIDPDYTLVDLLAKIIDGAVSPEEWDRVSATMCTALDPTGTD